MDKKKIAIETTKYAFAVIIGGLLAAVAKPAIDSFLKIKDKPEETTLVEDIDEEATYTEV